ncbi:MAG TPA: acetyl-CoA carboxylase biotin carboxyl carrier protein subunit, partial [Thermaerobacter sp.]
DGSAAAPAARQGAEGGLAAVAAQGSPARGAAAPRAGEQGRAGPGGGSGAAQADGQGQPVTAPLPGVLLEVRVRPGDRVEAGQVVAILEAMKMENELAAPCSGRVTAVPHVTGQTLNQGDVVAWIDPEG